jgi:hypothetical protein
LPVGFACLLVGSRFFLVDVLFRERWRGYLMQWDSMMVNNGRSRPRLLTEKEIQFGICNTALLYLTSMKKSEFNSAGEWRRRCFTSGKNMIIF